MPSTPQPAPASGLRRTIEGVSHRPLTRLYKLPRVVVPVVTLVLLAVGVLAPPTLALFALTLLFLFVCWIAYLSWPIIPLSGQLMRIAMLVLIVVLAAVRLG